MSISTCHVSKTRLNISEGTRGEQQLLVVTYKLVSNPQIIAMSSPGHFRPGLMRCCTEMIKRPFYFFFWPTGQWQRIRPLKATLFAAASNAVPSSAVRSNHFLPNIGILASKRPILEHDFPVQDIYFFVEKSPVQLDST